jgi:hypothetical protein
MQAPVSAISCRRTFIQLTSQLNPDEQAIATAYVAAGCVSGAARITRCSKFKISEALQRPLFQRLVECLTRLVDEHTYKLTLANAKVNVQTVDYVLSRIIDSKPSRRRGFAEVLKSIELGYQRLGVSQFQDPRSVTPERNNNYFQ